VALLFNLPIQQVLPYINLPRSVQLTGVDGSLLKGSVEEVRINGFPIQNITYRYKPSCIPLLKVCYRIDYSQGQIKLAYDLLNGDTEVSRSNVEYPAAQLLQQLPNAGLVKPSGRLQLAIDDMSMLKDKLVAVSGKLIWRDLGLNDDGIKLDIGDYQVDFTGSPKSYEFTFSDLDAALDVSGDGSINAAGRYEVDVRITSESGIDPQVKSILNLIATRGSVNKYRIEQKGQLPRNLTRQLFR